MYITLSNHHKNSFIHSLMIHTQAHMHMRHIHHTCTSTWTLQVLKSLRYIILSFRCCLYTLEMELVFVVGLDLPLLLSSFPIFIICFLCIMLLLLIFYASRGTNTLRTFTFLEIVMINLWAILWWCWTLWLLSRPLSENCDWHGGRVHTTTASLTPTQINTKG